MSIEFHILSIFPGMFPSVLNESILRRAGEKGLLSFFFHDLRDYAVDRHRVTDDYPYGGGSGMVMKPEPLARAIEGIKEKAGEARTILMTPQGAVFDQNKAWELSRRERLILVCGRYEGVDERIRRYYVDEEISIGDYVLTGGEIPAMVVADAVSRLVPGVLGDEGSLAEESFSIPMLEYPQYTRPENFRGYGVPPVLLSGNHAEIQDWRRREALRRTLARRPDLLEKKGGVYIGLVHYPVYNKHGEVVATSITTIDLHDFSRVARTYGIDRFYVVTPLKSQRELAKRVFGHWTQGYGAQYNPTRKEAVSRGEVKDRVEDVIKEVESLHGKKPKIVITAARAAGPKIRYEELKALIAGNEPIIILFGTGWGMEKGLMARADYILPPIQGEADYNHLPVRAAAAITLDRILGDRE